MDKGIRPYCNNKFVELNEERRRGNMSNLAFRKGVIYDVVEQFGISVASASTHYNYSFKMIKELNAELVSGLGRAEDKKGGRKPKAKPAQEVAVAVADELTPEVDGQTVFRVCKKADDSVIAEGLNFEDARVMVAKAAAAKKAKLYWV